LSCRARSAVGSGLKAQGFQLTSRGAGSQAGAEAGAPATAKGAGWGAKRSFVGPRNRPRKRQGLEEPARRPPDGRDGPLTRRATRRDIRVCRRAGLAAAGRRSGAPTPCPEGAGAPEVGVSGASGFGVGKRRLSGRRPTTGATCPEQADRGWPQNDERRGAARARRSEEVLPAQRPGAENQWSAAVRRRARTCQLHRACHPRSSWKETWVLSCGLEL